MQFLPLWKNEGKKNGAVEESYSKLRSFETYCGIAKTQRLTLRQNNLEMTIKKMILTVVMVEIATQTKTFLFVSFFALALINIYTNGN